MKGRLGRRAARVAILMMLAASPAGASDPEIEQLRNAVSEMQRTIESLNRKIERLERERTAVPPAPAVAAPAAPPAAAPGAAPAAVAAKEPLAPSTVAPPPATPPTARQAAEGYSENVLTSQGIGPQAPIDPSLRGFIRIPNTGVIVRFNAKPRVDFTYDTKNAGDDNRFVTAKIPVDGSPDEGDGPIFNANGRGSQLILDARAPEVAGSPRFYYQNDFFGSGGGEFPYRVQHLYGSIYGVTVGQTFTPFEDPDVWPDTVDYEGPNSMIFARFPLVRYKVPFNDYFALNAGIAQPSSEIAGFDAEVDDEPVTVKGLDHAPDFSMNLRGESPDVGHIHFGSLFRYLGAKSSLFGEDEAFGWGVNLAGGLLVPLPWSDQKDLLLAQGTYGEGMGRYGNDSGFFPTDAAFSARGELVPLPYYGAFAGYTHRWLPDWRSTATYGWVKVDNEPTQGPDAYHQTQYASVNLIWQLRERLSVGVEALYGNNQLESGAYGDVFRTQVGVAYSLF